VVSRLFQTVFELFARFFVIHRELDTAWKFIIRHTLAVMRHTFKFVNTRKIAGLRSLSAIETAQLRLAGKLYDGQDVSLAGRLEADDANACFLTYLENWDVASNDEL
jgi:hypothetical protein